ncbi:hypothetical protein K493DRAFT_318115 [Basidiobolus meristosporus CBS 931.73]|uniref:Arrestin-like N-terminal domain-containing protein n=1 Tax=Basidiobolus meristosporus CBS 931.73 TaxID=1314790 RepID=A0A1Y1XXL5_9FUNG|nr:hypothetical protein K493DRAFT_318115 [Basidiobolus meristosporus CBS 931.73]|eukprot:ORX90226.1 hypothetical protein K493DRAFT_318115 [Basidiobolus meristosporus CBS 931.73]
MSKTLFEIQTPHDTFCHNLHNWRDGLNIKGNLLLSPSATISLSQITLRFIGRLTIKQDFQKFEKVLVEKSWSFIPEGETSHTFGPQPHSFGFQFELPGDLPESLHTPNCKIEYTFYATAKTSLFRSNLKARKVVTVRKTIGPILGTDCSTRREGVHKDLIAYDIAIPALDFSHGDCFHVNFKFHMLKEGILPKFIACGLRERVVYRIPMEESYTHKISEESWVMATIESYQSNENEKTLLMQVPKSADKVQYSHLSDYVEISHYLYGQIQFADVNVEVSFPVLIARHEAITPELPPAYEDTHLLPPPYQPIHASHTSRFDQYQIIPKPIVTVVSKSVKQARRMSMNNPISILTH